MATTTVKAIAVKEGMNDSIVTSAAFTKKTSGSSGGSSRPTKPAATDSKTDTNPTIDGKSKSWSDICIYIKNLPAGSTSVINMNGETKLPADVIKAISESKARVELLADSSKSWIIDGSKIITVSAADFSILPGNADKSGLRGVTGADIKINNIGIPADLKLTFRKEFAGQFANLYKVVDGKLVFQSCARVGDDGTSVVSGMDSKSEYVVMVCKFSDIVGDMSNDGVLVVITILNAKNNKIDRDSFLELAKSNRIFGYVFWQLADFKLGKDIRLYDSADMMCGKAQHFSDEQIGIWRSTMRKQRKNSWGMDAVNALRDGISYFYIGFMAVTKAITVGDFSMCVSAAGTLYWSLYGIVSGVQTVSQKCAYAHRYIEFLRFPAAMVKGTKPVKPGEHTIEFRHVSFKYPRSEKLVLRDINLTIKSGEHLSIVGLNGAGKTTFIKLLCRLYDVTEGEILVDGVNIKEYSEEEYRRLFAVVFQDFQLFAFSLRENIAFGEQADDKELERVLKLAGLWEDVQKLPNGLDTMLYKSFDENGTDLSGGQRQKTAIARALYRNAPVVILDEPTAALDPVAEYEIYRQFNTLVGEKTAVYISHRLSSCKFCDRIVVFADDTIKENGTHEQLVGIDGGIYAGMFAEQAKYYAEG